MLPQLRPHHDRVLPRDDSWFLSLSTLQDPESRHSVGQSCFTNSTKLIVFLLGLTIDCQTVVLVSDKHHPVGSTAAEIKPEEIQKADIIFNPARTSMLTPGWGQHVTVQVINDALHDVLLSEAGVEDKAYNFIFKQFEWMLDEMPAEIDPQEA